MANIRIYILAKELGVQSKVLVERCKDAGMENVKSHMSSIPEEVAEQFRQEFTGPPSPAPAPQEKKQEATPQEKATPERKESDSAAAKSKGPRKQRQSGHHRIEHVEFDDESSEEAEVPSGHPSGQVAESKPKEKIKLGSHRSYLVNDTQTTSYEGRRRTRRFQRPNRRSRRPKTRSVQQFGPEMLKGQKFTIQLPITVRDLSAQLKLKQTVIIRDLMKHGVYANINDALEEDQITMLALDYEIEVDFAEEKALEDEVIELAEQEDKTEDLRPRPPVVTFLGHVDHGKTSLLDKILHTRVAEGESGGITQHIAAHTVRVNDSKVVFLDTPGHEAFTEMRARGANVTDIVVLVIAADDGIMPQTEEAIHHARAAEVPIVVALNKIDRPNAKPEQVLSQLSAHNLQPEEWGGDTIVVRTSAITGEGVEGLLEMLALQAEILELKANPVKPATGTVIESRLTEGRGVEATLLVKDGTLRRGDVIVAGDTYCRVRGLLNDADRVVKEAGPATPVKVMGFHEAPNVSSRFYVLDSLQRARDVAAERHQKDREATHVRRPHLTLENLSQYFNETEKKEARFILKADVRGSIEVLEKSILDLSNSEITLRILHSAVGGINESDVLLADASDAIIIGFHVVPDARARALADEHRVSIDLYQVIYKVIEDVKSAMEGMLAPEERENTLGYAEIRQIFTNSRYGNIAGCLCRNGSITRNSRVRLVRDGVIIHDGRLASLRRFNDDVREVREGLECGMRLEGYDDIKVGDIIQAYEIEKIARTLASVTP